MITQPDETSTSLLVGNLVGGEIYTQEETREHGRFHSRVVLDILRCHMLSHDNLPIYDFGCGDGWYCHQLEFEACRLRRDNCGGSVPTILGIEGSPVFDCVQWHKNIIHPIDVALTDLVFGPPGNVCSIEVGEHIAAVRAEAFLDNLVSHCARYLVLSWAVPGQVGKRHINCLSNNAVIARVSAKGLQYLRYETEQARRSIRSAIDAGYEADRYKYFANTVMIFKKA